MLSFINFQRSLLKKSNYKKIVYNINVLQQTSYLAVLSGGHPDHGWQFCFLL